MQPGDGALTDAGDAHGVRIPGDGIIVRSWQERDIPLMPGLFDDADVARWTPLASPFDLPAATAYYERAQTLAATRLQLAICEASNHPQPLGEVMLDLPTAMAGYVIGRQHRGRGLASRALVLITDYAHRACAIPVVALVIAADNVASQVVAERAGYRVAGDERLMVNKGVELPVVTWIHTSATTLKPFSR